MSREIRRVPLDFDWPLDKVWQGYVCPVELQGDPCTTCNASGQTHFGAWINAFAHAIAMLASDVHDQKRGRAEMHPWLKEFGHAPGHFEYMCDGEWFPREILFQRGFEPGPDFRAMPSRYIIDRPGDDALTFFRGLITTQYTDRFAQDDEYAKYYDPTTVPPPEQIGSGLGHSSAGDGSGNIQNAIVSVLTKAAGADFTCAVCAGEGMIETREGQFAERDAWTSTKPPTGEGWQMWETVSEGSPVSPVFESAEALAQWLTTAEGGRKAGPSRRPLTIEQARGFVGVGWAPSGFGNAGGLHDGATYVGTEAAVGELFEDGGES